MFPSIFKDLSYGLRQLRRSPAFTVVAVASLALGIGANTAIFQLVDAIRLRTLPARAPEELVSIDLTEGAFRTGAFSDGLATLTHGQWEQIRDQQQAFTGVLAWSTADLDLTPGGARRFAEALYVSGNFFSLLGVPPILGRTFTPEDDTPGCHFGAVISHAFWQRELGGDPGVLGRRLTLEGSSIPILGVTPASFHGVEVGDRYDVAVPLCAEARFAVDGKSRLTTPDAWWLSMMGRLRPGWTLERANAHLRALSAGIMRATVPPSYRPDFRKQYLGNQLQATGASGGISDLREDYERPLWLMLATSALVLLIACANLANLLLARARVREREIAIRLAMGASRARLVRQLLVESLLLACAGAAVGILLASTLSEALVAFMSGGGDPLFIELPLDWRMLGFTAALAVLTCLLFGLFPALRATRLAPAWSLRSGGRSLTAGRERVSLRRALVVVQVALSVVLLVGALLFARSLRNLLTSDAGFRPEGVFAVELDLAGARIPSERRLAVFRELEARLGALPGVERAAQVRFTPVSESFWSREVGLDGAAAVNSGKGTYLNRVGPDYFRVMGTPVIAGRVFDRGDTLTSVRVAIVNEVFARRYYGEIDVVGRAFHMKLEPDRPPASFRIVGVVANSKYLAMREDFLPIAYVASAQDFAPRAEAVFVLQVPGASAGLMRAVTAAVGGVDPRIGIQLRSFSAQLRESLARERLVAILSSAFALLAVLLAMLGLYGVVSYLVSQRRSEIGLRMALGADGWRVVRLVLGETLLLLGVGLGLGLLTSLWAARAAAALLYGLSPDDPLTLAVAAALLASVALLASYGPARRAARIEPMLALRSE